MKQKLQKQRIPRARKAVTHVDHRSHKGRSFRQLGSVIGEMRKLISLSSSKDYLSSLTNSLEGQEVLNIRCHRYERYALEMDGYVVVEEEARAKRTHHLKLQHIT